ncbi:MAG: peptidoglycan DD-metalloendopeptidase family protein [Neisseriaceae bacterium]|nr:peptidoglycan DD-metalloendopeptidase family protein [Neisseriaceae bacterium]
MTLHKILPLSLLALSLSACGILSQQPAPVETATPTTVQPVATNNNPYAPQDDMPYTPPAATPAPVQPAPVSGSTYTPPNSTYIPSNAPVDPNATTHTVVYGDTVYNLSKRYNINADELRSLNNIVDNNITIGQVLRLPNRGAVATPAPAQPAQPVPAVAPATPATPAAAPVVSGSMRQVGGVTWSRPTNGQIFSNFGGTNKGVKYSGQSGQPIYAAADGEVKYSGSGLRGYGNLLIIQHNSKYLTAYGNNATIMVKEGQKVKRGQQIATMGNTDATQTQLHFEVRENGNAVDPTKFVP